jgi:hypothetical protein
MNNLGVVRFLGFDSLIQVTLLGKLIFAMFLVWIYAS